MSPSFAAPMVLTFRTATRVSDSISLCASIACCSVLILMRVKPPKSIGNYRNYHILDMLSTKQSVAVVFAVIAFYHLFATFTFYLMFYPSQALREMIGPVYISSKAVQMICAFGNVHSVATVTAIVACALLIFNNIKVNSFSAMQTKQHYRVLLYLALQAFVPFCLVYSLALVCQIVILIRIDISFLAPLFTITTSIPPLIGAISVIGLTNEYRKIAIQTSDKISFFASVSCCSVLVLMLFKPPKSIGNYRTFAFYLMFYPSQALREKIGPVYVSSTCVQIICVIGNVITVSTLVAIVACGMFNFIENAFVPFCFVYSLALVCQIVILIRIDISTFAPIFVRKSQIAKTITTSIPPLVGAISVIGLTNEYRQMFAKGIGLRTFRTQTSTNSSTTFPRSKMYTKIMYAETRPETRPNRALSASVFPSQDPYRCYINTDKRVYEPGDRVRCKVELTFDRKFICDEIVATITGEAKVQWTDKQASGVSLARNQRRTLFKQEKTIWTAQSTARARSSTLNDIVRYSSSTSIRTGSLLYDENVPAFRGFEAGRHKLPVEFPIPEEDMYTSIEVDEELVSVRYQIDIQCFHGLYPKNFVQVIHVIAPRDLNYEFEMLSKPTSSEKTMDKDGKLMARLTLPKTGFTPGEPLNAQIRIDNKTAHSVKYASVYIVKQITAISEKPVRDMKTREDETYGSIFPFHKIVKGEAKEWQSQLHLPALTPNFCIDGFMQVNYVAKLSVGFERGARKNAVLHVSAAPSPQHPTQVPRMYPSLADPSPMTTLPSAPPLYAEIDGHCETYTSVDDELVPYNFGRMYTKVMYAEPRPDTRPNRALSALIFPSHDPYRCFINTDKRVYEPGDRVRCKVELTFDRYFICDEIVATFTGEVKVQWNDKQAFGVSLPRSQRRTLFKQEKTIWTSQSTSRERSSTLNRIGTGILLYERISIDENVLAFRGFEAGRQKLPVEFQLPDENIYTSLEVGEELVSVRYQIEIQCLYGLYPKNFVQVIHVIAPRDLNHDFDMLSKPARSAKTIDKHGKLRASLALPKTGYTPGEPLNAQIRIDNTSAHAVKYASVYIVKQIMAISDKPVRDIKTREDETYGSIFPFQKIVKGESKEWQAQLFMPALTPNFCIDGFMQVKYVAKLSVGFERGARKNTVLHVSIPITIGTVALDPALAGALHANPSPPSLEDCVTQVTRMFPSLAGISSMTALPTAPPQYSEIDERSPTYSSIDHELAPYLLGMILCATLLFCLMFRTRHDLGMYRYLQIVTVSIDAAYTAGQMFIQERVITADGVFAMIPKTSFEVSKRFLCIYLAFYTLTLVMVDYNFLYRMWAVKSPSYVCWFSKPEFIILLIVLAFLETVVWFSATYFLYEPTEWGTRQMQEDFSSFNMPSVAGVSVLCGVMAICFGFMLHAILSIISELRITKIMSKKTKKMQQELFVTQCLQAATPLAFLYMPCGVMIVIPLFRIVSHPMAHATPILVSSFLPFNALAILLSMSDYRRDIVRVLRCGRKQANQQAMFLEIRSSVVL
ncbi:hypothetical protein PRIPAC_77936 [Pristionchus pacificus]|uniref:G protein-coupled receptor n=1 Tax=Pristionchus pacificus TaxID=54126 RepID=A0A2A6CJG2_PRIPA|nr:hypothetical protein PRIPAC_77936 [Pristionchus pacificus]|eukprot:PDM78364.1 G protein-coupled receptor [Pristionchus pacificus]